MLANFPTFLQDWTNQVSIRESSTIRGGDVIFSHPKLMCMPTTLVAFSRNHFPQLQAAWLPVVGGDFGNGRAFGVFRHEKIFANNWTGNVFLTRLDARTSLDTFESHRVLLKVS